MNKIYPNYSEHSLPECIKSNDPKVIKLHKEAVESILECRRSIQHICYYQHLCNIFLKEKLYEFSITIGNEGLKVSYENYSKQYGNFQKQKHFPDSNSEFFIEGLLSIDIGKAIEIEKGYEESVRFYSKYLKEGHSIYGIANAVKRLVVLYRKLKLVNEEKNIIEYAIGELEIHQGIKIDLQERLDKLNNKSTEFDILIKTIEINQSKNPKDPYSYPLYLSNHIYEPPELDACNYFLENNSIVFKTENTYWWSIQSLLYHEEIFADIPDQFFPGCKEINGMPLDFFSGHEFYERRINLFKTKNEYLCNSEINELIVERFHKYKNERIRHLILEHITLEGLKAITSVVPNNIIVKICDKINSNVSVYRTGLPDLFISNGKDKFKFIEVKKNNESVKPTQKKWIEYLLSIGVNVEVCRVRA